MTISIGDQLPSAEIFQMGEEGPAAIDSAALFNKGKVILFAVPGAFTPTCHNKHVPGFLEKAADFKQKGVDQIYCIAMNDPFVMRSWGETLGASKEITFLSDGNGAFTKALGLDFDGSGFGLSTRSQRYAMLVQDGQIKQLFIEDSPVDADRSSAENLLSSL